MPTLNEAFQDFILDRTTVRRVRPASLRYYKDRLKPFLADVGEMDVTALQKRHIRAYIAARVTMNERYANSARRQPGGLSEDSIASDYRALRAFIRFCVTEYGLPTNPLHGIHVTARGHRLPKAADMSDVDKVIASIDASTVKGKRDIAMLLMLADTGLRAGGLCSMTLDRTKIMVGGNGQAHVVEKGGQERVVNFTDFATPSLIAWLKVRPKVTHRYIFCALGGKEPGKPLTVYGLNQALEDLKRKAGIKGRLNPHSLRHMHARESLRNGNDLASVSQQLGHSTISVTAAYYAVFTSDELAERQQRFSPLRRLLKFEDLESE